MRYLLPLVLLLAGCGGCSTFANTESIASLALRLQYENGLCSGTPIGRDLILSAAHCNAGGRLVAVNGTPVRMIGYGERADTATYRIAGLTFKRWGRMGRTPKIGDRVRFIGNPQGVPNVYREGYVAQVTDDLIVVDTIVCKGDSGSALWDDAGRIVGIVNAMTAPSSCHFGLSIR